MERRQTLKATRAILMAARDNGGDKSLLYRIWLHTSHELDSLEVR